MSTAVRVLDGRSWIKVISVLLSRMKRKELASQISVRPVNLSIVHDLMNPGTEVVSHRIYVQGRTIPPTFALDSLALFLRIEVLRNGDLLMI